MIMKNEDVLLELMNLQNYYETDRTKSPLRIDNAKSEFDIAVG